MKNIEDLKVLYVGSPQLFEKGASSIHMMKMCQAMSNLGIQVELVLPGNFSKESLFKYYDVKPNFNIKTIRFTYKFARQIVHGIASSFYANSIKENYDFVLTRNLLFAYMATKYFSIPTIYDAHHPPVNGLARSIIKYFSNSNNLLGMSFNSNGLLKIYNQNKIDPDNKVVAHNGVEIDKFYMSSDKEELRKSLNLAQDSVLVTYSGNTYEGRGIEYLIDVAKELLNIEFLVVGGKEEDNKIYKRIVKEIGIKNFKFTGFVEQKMVAQYLLASDILVMPYSNNVTIRGGKDASGYTSPIKLFEYMAAEKPIIATSIPPVMEILRDGMNAIVIKPDSTEELRKAIKAVIKDKNIAIFIAKNARRQVIDYTWEKRVEKILSGLNVLKKLS